VIEGIAHADQIRDLVMTRMRESRTGGLGDDSPDTSPRRSPESAWSPAHLTTLREIRDELLSLGTMVAAQPTPGLSEGETPPAARAGRSASPPAGIA
jgi:hypothetical protein